MEAGIVARYCATCKSWISDVGYCIRNNHKILWERIPTFEVAVDVRKTREKVRNAPPKFKPLKMIKNNKKT